MLKHFVEKFCISSVDLWSLQDAGIICSASLTNLELDDMEELNHNENGLD